VEGEEAPFSFEWVPTDAWRGHYETKHNDGLVKIFDDSILSYHESEQMLKALHDISLKAFDLMNVDYYRVFSRTSNLFCTNMDIYIEKAKEELGKEIIETAKNYVNYDNPVFSTGILLPRSEPAPINSPIMAKTIPFLYKPVVIFIPSNIKITYLKHIILYLNVFLTNGNNNICKMSC